MLLISDSHSPSDNLGLTQRYTHHQPMNVLDQPKKPPLTFRCIFVLSLSNPKRKLCGVHSGQAVLALSVSPGFITAVLVDLKQVHTSISIFMLALRSPGGSHHVSPFVRLPPHTHTPECHMSFVYLLP